MKYRLRYSHFNKGDFTFVTYLGVFHPYHFYPNFIHQSLSSFLSMFYVQLYKYFVCGFLFTIIFKMKYIPYY